MEIFFCHQIFWLIKSQFCVIRISHIFQIHDFWTKQKMHLVLKLWILYTCNFMFDNCLFHNFCCKKFFCHKYLRFVKLWLLNKHLWVFHYFSNLLSLMNKTQRCLTSWTSLPTQGEHSTLFSRTMVSKLDMLPATSLCKKQSWSSDSIGLDLLCSLAVLILSKKVLFIIQNHC